MNDTTEQSAKEEASRIALRNAAMNELDAVTEGLAAMAAKYDGVVYDVTTTKGMAEAKAARLEIREPRYKLERIRKEKTGELAKLGKEINARAKEVTDRIMAIETPIDDQIKAEEERKEQERAERQRIEQEKIQKQQDALASLTGTLGRLFGASAEAMTAEIAALSDFDMSQFDDAFLPSAQQAQADAIAALTKARADREEMDRQAAEIERQKAEQARLDHEAAEARRAADAAAQAERDRLAAEAKAKADAEEAERRAKLQAEEDARREQQQLEDAERRDRLAAEDRARAEQAERDRLVREAAQKVLDEQQAELDRQAEEQLAAQEKAEQDQRDREAAALAEVAQRAADAEEASIQAATAREAMTEALGLLNEAGYADHITTRKLAAVLAKGEA